MSEIVKRIEIYIRRSSGEWGLPIALLQECSDEIQRLTTALENARKDAWQSIETLPNDGQQVMFWSPLGECFIAPSVLGRNPTTQESRKIYEHDGSWPNVGWNPTHWQPLPKPPSLTPPTEKAT